jgi:hypothetical protein
MNRDRSCIEAFWRGSERAFQDEVGLFRAKGARDLSPPRRMERSGTLGIGIIINAALKERKS